MTVTTHATLTADATHHNTGAASAFAEPSAKTDRGKPNGYVRLGNKRAAAPGKPKPVRSRSTSTARNASSETIHPRNANDKAARAGVIEHFAVKYRADLACDGPTAAATQLSPSA
jgi:hypothetical protein